MNPRAPLGMEGKSVHARGGPGKGKPEADPERALRAKAGRYRLQRQAQGLLHGPTRETKTGKMVHRHAVCGCGRYMAGGFVSVYRAVDGTNARYSGLISCGSVWTCPVCSHQVRERRREDLIRARDAWRAKDGARFFLSLTFPHERADELTRILPAFKAALKRFKNSRVYKRLMQAHGHQGSVRALEVTHGVNGWHPHVHEIGFVRDPALLDGGGERPELYSGAAAELRDAWIAALLREGLGIESDLSDMLAHALHLQSGEWADQYITTFGHEPKWDETRELVGAAKRGRGVHRTPFELLADSAAGDDQAAALFRVYAEAFEGSRLLYWSPKLRERLGMGDDVDDAALAAEPELPAEEHVMQLAEDEWRLVIRHEARGALLRWAALGGEEGARAFLEDLAELPGGRSDHVLTRRRWRPQA